mmetsp:Transcript_1718/g.5487  ORF Transcript_1718/g.5487 Transcript_1718/m.5487 type:complete len:103 (-) Transcript_1718:783-1091(-)
MRWTQGAIAEAPPRSSAPSPSSRAEGEGKEEDGEQGCRWRGDGGVSVHASGAGPAAGLAAAPPLAALPLLPLLPLLAAFALPLSASQADGRSSRWCIMKQSV